MLHLQQELSAAHKLVAHLKIELEAANGKIDILRCFAGYSRMMHRPCLLHHVMLSSSWSGRLPQAFWELPASM